MFGRRIYFILINRGNILLCNGLMLLDLNDSVMIISQFFCRRVSRIFLRITRIVSRGTFYIFTSMVGVLK